MRSDLLANPDAWENGTLERYLEALSAVLSGLRFPDELTMPPTAWTVLAQILYAATGYE